MDPSSVLLGIGLAQFDPDQRPQTPRPKREHQIILTEFDHTLTVINWLGISPIYWDRENGVARIIKDRRWKLHYYATLSVIFTVEGFLIAGFVNAVLTHGFQFHDMNFIYQVILFVPGAFSMLLHIHTAARQEDLVILLNGLMIFWKTFTAQYTRLEEHESEFQKHAEFLSRMIKFVTVSLFLASLSAMPSYLVGGCQFHPFTLVIPVCYHDMPFDWRINIFLIAILAFLDFLWCLYEGASAMILFLIGCTLVVFSGSVWNQLESPINGRKAKRSDHMNWVGTFRQLQILSEYMNTCLSHDIFPSFIISFMLLCILMITAIVTTDSVTLLTSLVFILLTLITILFAFVEFSAKYHARAQEFIRKKKSRLGYRRTFLKRVYTSCDSCSSFRIKIGPYFYIKKTTFVIVASAIIENACLILILGK